MTHSEMWERTITKDTAENRIITLETLQGLIKTCGIQEINIDDTQKIIYVENRTDCNKLIVALGRGTFKLDKKGNNVLDFQGVPQLDDVDESVRVIDESAYGMPYFFTLSSSTSASMSPGLSMVISKTQDPKKQKEFSSVNSNNMKPIHQIQLQILKKLLFARGLRYNQLKPDQEMENNQFDFHLKQLLSQELVVKQGSVYCLTTAGKRYASRMDTKNTVIPVQSKISVRFTATKGERASQQILVFNRTKHPFYGCQGFGEGKLRYGETVEGAAKRQWQEETGLIGNPKIVGVTHYFYFDPATKELLEDRFVFLCLMGNVAGTLNSSPEGEYQWVNTKDLRSFVSRPFISYKFFESDLKAFLSPIPQISLQEIKIETKNY